jgi:uncharacterized protein YkwD
VRTILSSVVVVLLCLLVLHAQSPGQKKPAKFEISADEQTILDLTNKEREKEKLPPLKPNARLFKAARDHSQNMANQEWMLHELDGKSLIDRLRAAGYRYSTAGENIGSGFKDRETLMKMWMDSEIHRANILSKRFQEIGIGVAYSETDSPYYTQVFASPGSR